MAVKARISGRERLRDAKELVDLEFSPEGGSAVDGAKKASFSARCEAVDETDDAEYEAIDAASSSSLFSPFSSKLFETSSSEPASSPPSSSLARGSSSSASISSSDACAPNPRKTVGRNPSILRSPCAHRLVCR